MMDGKTTQFPDVETEDTINFEPNSAEDIIAFKNILNRRLEIFEMRRITYGNHIENAKRFPFENIAGLYLKCVRTIRQIEDGDEIDENTLLDLGNYCDLIVSSKTQEEL